MIRKCQKTLMAWQRDRRGNVIMLTALTIPAILAVAGLAIDFQNTVRQKGFAQHALDSAVLAGALKRQTGASKADVRKEVRDYFDGLVEGESGKGLSCGTITVTVSDIDQDVRGDLRCDQATYLSQVMGKKKMSFAIDATSTYGVGLLDVAFIFDVSGSMNNDGRLGKLKTSAKLAVDELLPDGIDHDGDVRLSIVTYNHAMNAGSVFNRVTRRKRFDPDTGNTQAKRRYDNHNDARLTDRATGERFFYYEVGDCQETYSWQCDQWADYDWDVARHNFSDSPGAKTCVYERIGDDAYTDAAPDVRATKIGAGNPLWNFDDSDRDKWRGQREVEEDGANDWGDGAFNGRYLLCEDSGPLPLTDDKSALKDHIDGLTASGGTAGQLGIAWGWYAISPEWSDVWPAGSEPKAYDTPDLNKAVILMTDGEFNTSHPSSSADSIAQSMALCDAMKAPPQNIQIFTVGFQVPESAQKTPNGETILEYCATSSAHNFDADNGEELSNAYRSIARSISDLRIKD